MKLTVSKEDYLKAIAEAEAEEGAVIAATIARWLGVTAPAVALALRRLRRDKLVQVDRKGGVSLTEAGRQISDKVRFRHHLIERMLHEMLEMEWYKVHDEAERLEHSVSEDVELRLIEKLGRDGPCPHGNQINKSGAERRELGLEQLWEAPPGSSVRIDSMHERDRKLLEYFDELGIRLGDVVGRIDALAIAGDHSGALALTWRGWPVAVSSSFLVLRSSSSTNNEERRTKNGIELKGNYEFHTPLTLTTVESGALGGRSSRASMCSKKLPSSHWKPIAKPAMVSNPLNRSRPSRICRPPRR